MSLWSYLNADSSGSSVSAQVAQAMRTIAAARDKATGASGTTSGAATAPVSITIEAKRAAAAKEDAGKTAADLAEEVRASLDKQYAAAGQKNSADLTTLSGRALATIALNETALFSPSEIAAAKQELRARDRQSMLSIISSGPLTAASLATYSQDMLAARDLMSAEEKQLRAIDPKLR